MKELDDLDKMLTFHKLMDNLHKAENRADREGWISEEDADRRRDRDDESYCSWRREWVFYEKLRQSQITTRWLHRKQFAFLDIS